VGSGSASDNGQSEASTTGVSGAGIIQAHETLKHSRAVCLINTCTVVIDSHHNV